MVPPYKHRCGRPRLRDRSRSVEDDLLAPGVLVASAADHGTALPCPQAFRLLGCEESQPLEDREDDEKKNDIFLNVRTMF